MKKSLLACIVLAMMSGCAPMSPTSEPIWVVLEREEQERLRILGPFNVLRPTVDDRPVRHSR